MTRNLKVGSLTVGFLLGISLVVGPNFVFAEENITVSFDSQKQTLVSETDYVTPSDDSFKVVDQFKDVADLGNGKKMIRLYQSPRPVYKENDVLKIRPDNWSAFKDDLRTELESNDGGGYKYSVPIGIESIVVSSGDLEFGSERSSPSKVNKDNEVRKGNVYKNNFSGVYPEIDVSLNDYGSVRERKIEIKQKIEGLKPNKNVIFWENYDLPEDAKVYDRDNNQITDYKELKIGGILIKNNEGYVVAVSGAFIFDATGDEDSYQNIKQIVKINGKKLQIGLVVDSDYLNDKNRVYPVTIDPRTYTACAEGGVGGNLNLNLCAFTEDVYFRSEGTGTIANPYLKNTVDLFLGYNNGPYTRQIAIDFNGFPMMYDFFKNYMTVTSAKLVLTFDRLANSTYYNGPISINAYKINNNWTPSDTSLKYSSLNKTFIGTTNTNTNISMGSTIKFDILSTFNSWMAAGSDVGGVALEYANNNNQFMIFRSYEHSTASSHPYMEIVAYFADLAGANNKVNGVSNSSVSAKPGDTISFSHIVSNVSSVAPSKSATDVQYYFADNNHCADFATGMLPNKNSVPTLLALQSTGNLSYNYTLDSNLAPGIYCFAYYINYGAQVFEYRDEFDYGRDNNTYYWTVNVSAPPKPDLTPNFFNINSNSYYTDNAFSANVLVENTGSASASNAGYLMQIQDTANGSVYNMTGCSSIGNIPGNSANVYTLSCTLPSSLPKSSANYYVNVNIDNNNYIDESNESNNTRQGSGTIVVVQYNYGGGGGGGADPNNNQVTLATKATVVNSNPLIAVNTQLANVSTYKNNNQISADKTSGNQTADPVNSRNGAFEFSQTDFTLRGLSLPIDFTRTYNSRYLERNVRFGQGWGNSYHMFYYQNPTTNEVQIYLGGALVSYFTPSGDGVNYVAGRGDFNTLYKESDYLVYKTQDGIKYRFSLKTTGDTNVAVLKEIEDTNGNKTILGYSNVRDVELLSSITDSSGRIYTFIYPSSTATDWDKVKEIHESISGSDRLIARFTYNASLNLTQVHHEASYTGESTRNIDEYYEYDANGLMTKYTDARGTILFNEYDSSGRVTKQYEHNVRVDGANVATKRLVYELTYNDSADAGVPGSAHCTITKNYRDASNHYDEKFCFNSDELKIYSEKGANIEKWSYDANGMASQYTDANNNITTYQYDSRRRLTQQVLPDTTAWHTVSTYVYEDNFNRLLKKTDNVSAVSAPNTVLYTKMTSTTIDVKGNVTGIKDTANNLEGFEYNVNGTIKKYTDKKGSITNFTYNANGYLTDESNSVTDVDGIVTTISKHYVYDNYGNRTNVTDGRGNVYAYAYDSLNNLRKITDPYSKTKLYQYDLESHRTKETDELGHVVDYSFDTDINASLLGLVKRSTSGDITNSRQYDYVGNVVKEIDPLNREILFGYDSANRVITKTDPRKTTTYEYNANGKLKKATTTAGTRIDYFYDARGNKTEEHRFFDATNYITLKWEYDGFNRVTKEIDGNNKSTVYEYDLMDRVTKKTDAKNGVSQFSYDANGNKTGERSPRATADASLRNSGGQSVSYVYDNLNRLIKTINAQNKETWYFYDGNNNLTKQVDWKNSDGTEATHVTQNTYDNLNRKTKTTFADGGELNFTYFDNGTVKTKTDQVGRVTTYTYDDFNRLTNEQDNGGKNTGYTYDKAGNKKTVTYQDSTQDKYDYNDLNKIAKVTDQLNNFSSYEYDAEGNKTKEVDKNNYENNFVFDKLGRPVSETNVQGTVTSYTYDGNNNRLTQTVDGKTTSFVYDELNRNTKITYPGNKTENFVYDANGNRTSYTNGNGEVIGYTYDGLNRNTGKTLSDANPVSYTYDNWSNLKNLVEDSGTNVYVYDVMNRATSETKTFKYLDDKQYVVAKEYFANGQLKKLTDATNKVVDYAYDDRGLLQGVTYSGTTLASYTYTAYGKPSVVTYGNGVVTTYTYDGLNRTKKIETKDSVGKVLWSESYDYDSDSNRTKMTDHTGRTVDYGYDNLNQLINTVYIAGGATSTFSYTYDNSGNRTSYTTPLNNIAYSYTSGTNELASVVDVAMATNIQYNNQGSVIKESYSTPTFTGDVNYTYTTENRLKNIDYVNNGVHNGIDFSYDDFGNRTRKRTFLNGETATYYLNQGLTVLNEIDVNGNVTKTIVQALGQIAEIDNNNNITYIHQDVLDSTALITDNTGAVVGEYDYDAFGAIIGYDGNTETNYTYTNQEYDPETELYYYNARYYNPTLGRFLTRDTVLGRDGDLLSRNLYIYVKNNPLRYTDPTGETPKDTLEEKQIEQKTWIKKVVEGARYLFGVETVNAPANESEVIKSNTLWTPGGPATSVGDWTDASDYFILSTGKKLDNTPASTFDKAFALGGVIIPVVSGSAVKKVGVQGVTKIVEELSVNSRFITKVRDISGFTQHSIDQIINRGIKPEYIKDTIENTLKYVKRIDELGRESYRYIGEKAVLNFNKAGEIITGWLK